MRRVMIGLAAFLLAGCSKGEVYPVPSAQAYSELSSIGTPAALDPLPGGLSAVSVTFEAVPGENKVQWLFTHEGDDIGRIVAKAAPDGASSTNVTVDYFNGTAPDGNWRNAEARKLIENQVQKLVLEAVSSTLENRSFDDDLRKQVALAVATSSIGGMLSDIRSSADEAAAAADELERHQGDASSASPGAPVTPEDVSKPTTDLNKFKNHS